MYGSMISVVIPILEVTGLIPVEVTMARNLFASVTVVVMEGR